MDPQTELRRTIFTSPGNKNSDATTTIVAPVGNCSTQLT
jgi:hypothetical protein